MAFTLNSPAFAPGEPIPQRFAYHDEGENHSPPLAWEGAPEGCQQFALLCDDPDAPREEPWVHWVLYGIPPERAVLDEDGGGAFREGPNDFDENGWGGPLPPPGHGTHHYHFKLFALDHEIGLAEGADKAALLQAIEGHVLAEAELIGTYERQ